MIDRRKEKSLETLFIKYHVLKNFTVFSKFFEDSRIKTLTNEDNHIMKVL
jgi:hypothetical protein